MDKISSSFLDIWSHFLLSPPLISTLLGTNIFTPNVWRWFSFSPFAGICLNSFPANVPSATRFPWSARRFPAPPFWSESDLEKLPVPLNKKLGLDRPTASNPLIRCGKKNRVSDHQPRFNLNALKKHRSSLIRHPPNLWNLWNLELIFCSFQATSVKSKGNQLPVGCWPDSTRFNSAF